MPLPRVHAFEFNDLESTPAAARDTIVESLSRSLRWGHMLRDLVGPFRRFLAGSGATEVLDLCAGAAGPATILASEMRRAGQVPPRFLLTDLFPRVESWEAARAEHPGDIDFVPEPVDATRIPEHLAKNRARAIINAFHHFPPDVAQALLADAVRGSTGVFVSEAFERNPLRFLPFGPVGVAALIANPILTRRDRLAKAAITWFSPIALSMSVWDGFVSTLRVYTEAELFEMVAPLGDTFRWEYGTYRFSPFGKGTYFFGVPRIATR
jgi:hypothetical protein